MNMTPFFSRLIAVALIMMIIGACIEPKERSSVAPTISLQMPNVSIITPPQWFVASYPEPGQITAVDLYRLEALSFNWGVEHPSVCITVSPNAFVEPGEAPSLDEVIGRFAIEIDEMTISEPDLIWITSGGKTFGTPDPITGEPAIVPGGAPYSLCYEADLAAGLHKATFTVDMPIQNDINYSWSFYLIDFPETGIAVEAPPSFLIDSRPRVWSMHLLADYEKAEPFHDLQIAEPAICLRLFPTFLSESLLSLEQVTSSSRLQIDGQNAELMAYEEASNNADYDLCYSSPMKLEPGLHTVTLTYSPSQGEHKYSWAFILLEQ